MNRTDTKFIFKRELLHTVLSELLTRYKCVEIAEKRMCAYQTLYYDTRDLLLYTNHHNGHLNRYKIRHRTYVDSDLGYLEVKFKNNKGRTVKERVKEKLPLGGFENKAYDFLSSELNFDPRTLVPAVWVNYSRITLVNKQSKERVTIDVGLHFKDENKTLDLAPLVIAEVKQEKKSHSPFLEAMRKFHVREGGISKYCFAIALTRGEVKKNNFKEKLLALKNIINYDAITGNNRSFR